MWAVLRIEVFSVRAASARRVVPYCSSNVTARFLQVLSHLLRRPFMTSWVKSEVHLGHLRFTWLILTSFTPVLAHSKMLLIRGTGAMVYILLQTFHFPHRTITSIPCFPFSPFQPILYFLFNVMGYMILLVSLIYSWQD